MNKDFTIETIGLTTGYHAHGKTKVITNSLDASLAAGVMTCLLGPNGAGKSTLLRTLAGFQKPLSGEIRIMGKRIETYKARELARCMSVVLTERPLLENMDVKTLVSLGRTPYTDYWGRLTAKDHEAVDKAISLVGIDHLRNHLVQDISDGERQKVMIAKAFAQETPVIFLDEPTAFLDYPSKVDIMLLLYSLAHRLDKTVFMSTHDLDIALQLSDMIWLIDRNKGVTTGTHDELSESGELENYFIRPGITFDSADGLFKIDFDYRSQLIGQKSK